MDNNFNLRFPIGTYEAPIHIDKHQLELWISEISSFPNNLQQAIKDLSEDQTLSAYRPEGWNIRQLVHHCADSHLNAYTRFKLSVTEDNPTIKPYNEAAWALHADANDPDLSASLMILSGIHKRWSDLMASLAEQEWERCFTHPEHGTQFSLKETAGSYAWHGKHHLAHIQLAIFNYEG